MRHGGLKMTPALVAKYGKGLMGMWRRGWHEYPELMTSCLGPIGALGIGAYMLRKEQLDDNLYKRYRMSYVVYRPDDPRVARIRKE